LPVKLIVRTVPQFLAELCNTQEITPANRPNSQQQRERIPLAPVYNTTLPKQARIERSLLPTKCTNAFVILLNHYPLLNWSLPPFSCILPYCDNYIKLLLPPTSVLPCPFGISPFRCPINSVYIPCRRLRSSGEILGRVDCSEDSTCDQDIVTSAVPASFFVFVAEGALVMLLEEAELFEDCFFRDSSCKS